MHLLLIRHAESQNNANYKTTNSEKGRLPDPGLTKLGFAQADALAKWLQQHQVRPTHAFVSPMRRAIQTAAPIAAACDINFQVDINIFERMGPFSGTSASALPHPGSPLSEIKPISNKFLFPPEVNENGWNFRDEVETLAQSVARAKSVAARIQDFAAEDLVMVVAHGGFNSLLLTCLIAPDQAENLMHQGAGTGRIRPWFLLENTSTSFLSIDNDGTRVTWINRTDHFALAGLTEQKATLAQIMGG